MLDSAQAIDTIAAALREEDAVAALFLSGSYATGTQDDYSDLDFVVVSPGGPSDHVVETWRGAVVRTGEIVFWRDRRPQAALINAITDDWLRIDVTIVTPEQISSQPRSPLQPLIDRDEISDKVVTPAGRTGADPRLARYQFEEFIRVLGLVSVAAGREEYINGVTGIFHLRNLLIELLVEETGAPERGGALHLNRLISDEQKALLQALPLPVATREGMITAHLAYAAAYLPRARRLARIWGVDWPERFETATWKRLHDTLSIEPPYARA
ncbi:hypothetical protein DLJ53_33250 [Acuticoccus sediminis]|uniref:Polymerase nucleotidyl transferase domain-containing protein n=1 Tax=Acuticoccus sediminis TaxID=2184697 RepID=A0A8B2NK06_9HYPH|nr:nucleotidyltransferase domain-containing protein [Acuticoccus sediminis]RAH96098.1 hypothetical protein DLJ53_33250 [Acuticoccus sediminis]